MKLGKVMDSQKTVRCTMEEEPEAKRKSKRHVTIAVAALVALLIVGAISLVAVYLGGKIATDTIQEASYVFHTKDGQAIEETITVTDTEEDIGLKDGTRIVYDFSKGFMTMKITEDGEDTCYITPFERKHVHAPSAEDFSSMLQENVSISEQMDYYVDKSSNVNPSVLSQRSLGMCAGSNVYWMSTTIKGGKTGRQRRGCKRVCKAYCKCCPRDCGVKCSIKCSF
ncbi:uncharacterized protein LOC123558117 isoform X2 [Mercenaria mercenaria]|uniref:uncharacterized protein LOC123558117 isoform X2 n=1 Tax=Mercenaria mercenaria TaxID=6596 RepID=UPI00234F63BB|nr:uncharacterized protein LOC123558117 isoform X2 [Mercenaria mercenaria]